MSRSPPTNEDSTDNSTYLRNWDALGTLISRGRSFSGSERNCCFLNLGSSDDSDGRSADRIDVERGESTIGPEFADVSAASQFDLIADCRGIATVDWDHDGDIDLWLSSRTAPGIHLMRNGLQSQNDWVAVKLEGTACNRDAIGARIVAHLRGPDSTRQLIRTVRAGDAFMSQSSKWVHFGLEAGEQVDRLTVRWPGQHDLEAFSIPTLRRRYRLVENSGRSTHEATDAERAKTLVARPTEERSTPGGGVRVVLTRRRELKNITYVDFSGNQRSLQEALPGPLLVTVWASWCPNCLGELRNLDQHKTVLTKAGVKVMALSIDGIDDGDGPNDPLQASAHIRESGFVLPAGVATRGALQSLHKLLVNAFYRERPFQVPASFLLDENGYVSVIYRGECSVDQVVDDAQLLASDDSQRIEDELYPLGGRSALGILAIDRLGFARAYYEGGYYDDSLRDTRQFIEKTQQRLEHVPNDDTRRNLADAFHHLAKTEVALGDSEQAIIAYENALQLFPKALGSRISLATLLMNQNRVDQAERELALGESLGAEEAKTYFSLARWRRQFQQTKKAISYYRKALELAPNDTLARLELAVALEADSQSGLAIEQYRQLLEKQLRLLAAANNLAWIHATSPEDEHRNGPKALRLAQTICEATDNQLPEYLDTLAAAFAESGRFEQAVHAAERAIQLATSRKNSSLLQQIASRIELYKSGKPFRSQDAKSLMVR